MDNLSSEKITKLKLHLRLDKIKQILPQNQDGSPVDYFEFELQGSAMEPNYMDRSMCSVDKPFYNNAVPQWGDVVLYNGFTSSGQETQWVKRIIVLLLNGL